MKRYTIGLITLLLIVGCGKKEDGLHTEEFEGEIYGRMLRTGNYKDGKKDGVWFFYIPHSNPPDTTLMWSKTYKDGKVDGLYTEYSTRLEKLGARKDFVDLDGKVIKRGHLKYFDSGQKLREGIYKGKDDRDMYIKVGVWTTWYIHGQKESEGTYKDGEIIGETFWYEDEKWADNPKKYEQGLLEKTEITYSDNPSINKMTTNTWYKNGNKAAYFTGINVPQIAWVGSPTFPCNSGCKIDESTTWYKNGQKATEYKDGYFSTGWYENRKKSFEYTYKDGKKDKYTSWHDNGQKSYEGNYKDGKKSGLWKSWHWNGQKHGEGIYEDGKKEREWTNWDYNGVEKKSTWLDGECITCHDIPHDPIFYPIFK